MSDQENGLKIVPIVHPEDGIFETYANIVNYNWTLTDVRLRFAELVHVAGEESTLWQDQQKVMMERAAITLPWIQVKVMRDALTSLITSYEELNGELKSVKLPNPLNL